MKENLIITESSRSFKKLHENEHNFDEAETPISIFEDKIESFYNNLLKEIGLEGKFQKYLFILFCLVAFICCFMLTCVSLQKDLPYYTCLENSTFEEENLKSNFYYNDAKFKIIKDQECVLNYCNDKENENLNKILIINLESKINFITELDIICEKENYFSHLTQMIFLGRILGNFIFSYFADKYGRCSCFILQFNLIVISYFILLLFKNKFVYLFVTLILCSCANLFCLISAMSTEVMSQKMYSLLNGLICACFSLCGIVNILVIYFIQDWNILLYLQLFICAISSILIKYYLTETPLFLLDQKNYGDLNEIIKKIAIENNTLNETKRKYAIVESWLKVNCIKKENKNDFKASNNLLNNNNFIESVFGPYLLVIKSQKTLVQIFKLIILYLSMNLIFYGQILNIEKMSGNIFLNSLIIYFGEIIAEISAGYILQKYPRKFLIILSFSCSSFFCFLVNYLEINNSFYLVKIIFIFTNSFFISILFVFIYVYTAEVFETNVKSTAISILNNLSNLFLLFSPYLLNMIETPYSVYTMFALIAALNGLVLKETKEL